jgi:hypothetical protein
VSFFDEDDEPHRTTTRARPRTTPRPRRGSPAGGGRRGGGTDAQQVLVRRMVGIIGIALVILVFGLLLHSCSTSRHKTALTDYNRQVNNIGTASAQTGTEFFRAMGQAANQSPEDLQQSISSFKVNAEQQLKQAQDLSTPDDMRSAQQSLLIGLELRRDGLSAVAGDIRTALGDQGDAADAAIKRIAGQMQAFNASDVLYDARVIPFIRTGLQKGGVGGSQNAVQRSEFLTEISWISPDYVAQQLGQTLNAQGGTSRNQPTGPGLHGTGLNATSYGSTTLQPGTTNRLTYQTGQGFTVSFTNQGDNDEFNVKVSLKIARDTGSPITINKTVQKVAKGEKATVTLPLNRQPPLDTAVTVSVVVAAVPGETKTDNNKSSYPSLFVRG